MLDDGFNDVEPDWPANKPAGRQARPPERKELKVRNRLGPDGWRKYLREVRKKSKQSLEGPEEVPLELRGERPTFNFPVYVSSHTKDSYRKRYEAKHERKVNENE